MVDVPLKITNPPSIQQNVRVEGGTNWDLSRSAVPTPIERLPDDEPTSSWVHEAEKEVTPSVRPYTPADGIPQSIPSAYRFREGKATLSQADTKALKALSKRVRYVVVGHASEVEASPAKLSWARANAAATVLRRSGHRVDVVKAFGNEKPADDAAPGNQRVEVFVAGSSK